MGTKNYKRLWAIIIIALLLVAIVLALGNQSFKATEQAAFDEFNQRQLVLATGVTNGIELYFETLARAMNALGAIPEVQDLDETSTRRDLQRKFDELEPLGVNDIGVLDAAGILKYNVVAHQIEGVDFSWRQYYQEAREMTSGDTYIIEFVEFKGVEAGQKGVLVAIPMFEIAADENHPSPTGHFAGVVLCTLKLDTITQRFIAPIRASERGHAFLIDNEYNVLWAAAEALFGKNLLAEGREFPAFQQAVEKMATGNTGTAEYAYYKFEKATGEYTGDKEEKLIAYAPIHLGKEMWAIGVWAPKEDARLLVRSAYRQQLFVVGLSIVIILFGSSYALAISLRASKLLEEEVEIKSGELKESHQRLLTVLDGLDAAVYVADIEKYEILFANKYLRDAWGDVVGKTCWQVLQVDQSGPCDFCSNARLLTAGGEPGDVYTWEFQNTITGHWYQIHDRAIRWVDGRIVRLEVAINITERKQAEESLQHYAKRLKILREIDQGILAARSPEAIAQAALSHMRQLVPCRGVGVALFDFTANEFKLLAVDIDPETGVKKGDCASLESFEQQVETLRQGNIVINKDVQPQDRIATILYAKEICSYLNVPLVSRGELIGFLNLAATDPDVFTEENVNIARQVADLLAVALQQTRLHEQIQHYATEMEQRVLNRTRELSALYDVTAVAGEPLDLTTMLERLLERVLIAMRNNMGVIHLLDQAEKMLRLTAQQGFSPEAVAQMKTLPLDSGLAGWVIEHGESLVVPNVVTDSRAFRVANIAPETAYVGAPIRTRGQVLGVLGVFKEKDQSPFSMDDVTLLASIADHVGVVVESARLRQQARQVAVMEERQRLARELHDSVTQSLYSLTLFAEWGRRLFEAGDLESAKQRLVETGETAQQALKEMRLLLYELRPAILEQDGLVKALQRRLEAVEKRTGVEVSLTAEPLIELPGPVEEGLYRIAQEALNNALKHAAAGLVTVRVQTDDTQVTLEIEDNGSGFVTDAVSNDGGLGLVTMQERATQIGGILTVVSAPGQGTRVKVSVNLKSEIQNQKG